MIIAGWQCFQCVLFFLQEILEKRSEMMNEYKSFRERATEEWESMKYRRLELRDGK